MLVQQMYFGFSLSAIFRRIYFPSTCKNVVSRTNSVWLSPFLRCFSRCTRRETPKPGGLHAISFWHLERSVSFVSRKMRYLPAKQITSS